MVAELETVVTAAGVVAVTVPILLLKIAQSAEDKAPLLEADAVGKLKVCILPVELMLKSVPAVPVEIVCTEFVNPFKEVRALPDNRLDRFLVVTLPNPSVVAIFVFVVLVPIP